MKVLALAVIFVSPAAACETPANLTSVQAETVRLVNAERRAAGRPALALSPALTAAAQGHACDSAARNRMSHTGSDGSRIGTRLKRVGYRFRTANENVGLGFRGPADAVAWWMASPPHRANILAPGTREIGVGMALGRSPHWVMVSGTSK